MQVKLLWVCLCFLMCLAHESHAQKDSIHMIDQILIRADVRVTHSHHGLKFETIDSTILANNLSLSAAEIISKTSGIYIKSYGGSGLASSSFRGGSANHTAIIWNGFNLQSPVTGMIDLSLIPAGIFNKINIQYGGRGAIWGSGAVGGVLHFNNITPYNNGFKAQLYTGLGSFNEKNILAAVSFSNHKFTSATKLFHSDALNNYSFEKPIHDSIQIQRLSNAAASQNTLMQENSFKITSKQLIETHLWLQENNRKIPPTLYQEQSDAYQYDRAIRLAANYHVYQKSWTHYFKNAYFNEALRYKDSELSIPNENKSETFINEFLSQKKIARHSLFMGINSTFATAKSVDFSVNTPRQHKVALFSSFEYFSKKSNLSFVASIRQEFVNTNKVPLTWSLGLDYYLVRWMKFKANAGRVYRIPTLNDLFWKEGGNQNLLPEDGYAFEAGTMLIYPNDKIEPNMSFEINVFSRKIKQWIIWLPNGSFWSPQNLMEVWSRGIETNTSYRMQRKHFSLFSNFKTNYVLSENLQSNLIDDASLNKQLVYIPMYSGQLNYGITWHQISAILFHTYTGYRYTSSDHTQYLEPYWMHHISIGYKYILKKVDIELQFQLNNFTNTKYQVITSRPMPGIAYRGGIVFQFKSNYAKQ